MPAAEPSSGDLHAPLGAAVFMATRFRSDDPVSVAAAVGQDDGDTSPFAQDLLGGSGALPGLAPLAGLQGARLMEDFDLPDTGFETHVFSTAELIDDDSFASTLASLPALAAADAPQGGESGQAVVQEAMAEIGAVPEVTGAYLLRQDGTTLASTGDTPLPGSVLAAIDALLQAAIMEGQRLNLGECGSVAVELPESALLLSPVAARVGLVVSVVDSSRLMPVRRLLRKPLGTLRAAFVAHDLS
jgi:predicted regulator of Ras-like GTPase activity (Roadblock/LC7/MglB family)